MLCGSETHHNLDEMDLKEATIKTKKNIFSGVEEVYEETREDVSEEKMVAICNENSDNSAITFLWFCFYSMLMFTLPFISYFGVKRYLQEYHNLTQYQIICSAAISSVVTVHFIIYLYVKKAFNEVGDEERKRKLHLLNSDDKREFHV